MKREIFPASEDLLYKRIFGGLSWPGARPGFIVVVGELKILRGEIRFVLLDEKEDYDTQILIKTAGALDSYYRCERWHGDTENKGAVKFLQEYNNVPQPGVRRLRLIPSRLKDLGPDVFGYLYPRLKRMAGENGSLDISRGAKLLGYMQQPQDSDITQIGWGDFPAIESLAFCVFELDREKNVSDDATKKAKHDSVKI